MATVIAAGNQGAPNTANLSAAQTGTGDTTNILDTARGLGPALLKITSTIGATPTATLNIQGSANGTDWYNVPYADSATPATWVITALTITTAVTSYKYLQPNYPWRYLKGVLSANTNVTLTIDAWVW